MGLTGIQIFKMTPKKNCKECGCPTCMAFAMKVAQGALEISKCPHMSDEALAELSEATAPPMKTIKVGAGDNEYTLGGETVLFRHDISKNNIFSFHINTAYHFTNNSIITFFLNSCKTHIYASFKCSLTSVRASPKRILPFLKSATPSLIVFAASGIPSFSRLSAI